MIKINLLPVKAAKRREQGQRQLLFGAIVFTLALVGVIVFHTAEASKINDMRAVNQRTSADIARLKAEIGDYELIKAQRDELIRQRDAIKRLQANRSGPVWMMRELSDILTKGKGPTFSKEQYRDAIKRLQANRSGPVWMMRELSDILTKGKGPTFSKEQYEEAIKRDPTTGFNPNWEPKRVWLLSYEEKSHAVKIRGAAKSDEDVAEFLKRLQISAFFSDVYWQQTQPQFDPKLNVSYVVFDVTCKVNY